MLFPLVFHSIQCWLYVWCVCFINTAYEGEMLWKRSWHEKRTKENFRKDVNWKKNFRSSTARLNVFIIIFTSVLKFCWNNNQPKRRKKIIQTLRAELIHRNSLLCMNIILCLDKSANVQRHLAHQMALKTAFWWKFNWNYLYVCKCFFQAMNIILYKILCVGIIIRWSLLMRFSRENSVLHGEILLCVVLL